MNATFGTLPSTIGQQVNLFMQGSGKERVYYYIAPFGMTRAFHTKHAAKAYARRNKWIVCDKTVKVEDVPPEDEPEWLAREASV